MVFFGGLWVWIIVFWELRAVYKSSPRKMLLQTFNYRLLTCPADIGAEDAADPMVNF